MTSTPEHIHFVTHVKTCESCQESIENNYPDEKKVIEELCDTGQDLHKDSINSQLRYEQLFPLSESLFARKSFAQHLGYCSYCTTYLRSATVKVNVREMIIPFPDPDTEWGRICGDGKRILEKAGLAPMEDNEPSEE